MKYKHLIVAIVVLSYPMGYVAYRWYLQHVTSNELIKAVTEYSNESPFSSKFGGAEQMKNATIKEQYTSDHVYAQESMFSYLFAPMMAIEAKVNGTKFSDNIYFDTPVVTSLDVPVDEYALDDDIDMEQAPIEDLFIDKKSN